MRTKHSTAPNAVLDAAARLAVQLGREPASEALTVSEVAADAIAIARIGQKVRRAYMNQVPADALIAKLKPLATKYHAQVVDSGDPSGMSVGLQFAGGTYTSGFANTFFVA